MKIHDRYPGSSALYATATGNAGRLGDLYIVLLAGVLCGYAVVGKGFATLGVPPLYVGELLLVFGVVVLFQSGSLIATFASPATIVLVALMGLVGIQTPLGFLVYGIDALRDSVVILYAVFAFVIAAVLLERPTRLQRLVALYGPFAFVFVLIAPMLFLLTTTWSDLLPTWPNSGPPPTPLIFVRGGEVAVHLAGAAAFTLLLSNRKPMWIWSALLACALATVTAKSRGGFLAFVVPVAFAVLASRRSGHFSRFVVVVVVLGVVALFANLSLPAEPGDPGDRGLRLEQVVANVTSIFSDSNTGNLDGTKEYRTRWWNSIIGYVIHGDYFWTGKGYGINLAISDGYLVGLEFGNVGPRVPHSVHMTILARSGVPGLVLWLGLLLTWFGIMIRNAVLARYRSEQGWSSLFIFLMCYALAIIIDASFDVAIEGPMIGIWFWTIIGIGIGASLIYASARPPAWSGLRMTLG